MWKDKEVYTNTPGTSEITGGGANTRVAYFTATANITGSADFTFDGDNLTLQGDSTYYNVNDADGTEIVKLGTLNIKNISINIGDLTDINYLNKISSNKFDHIIVSHVFSFILSEDTDNTVILRQSIIDNLIRISKKTIIIIDNNNILHIDKPEFEIEQIHRGHFKESIIKYFASHLNHGEVCSLYSDSSVGVLFIKN